MNNTLIQGIKRMSIACAVVAIAMLTQCTSDFTGGGGSEAGNARVAGIIFDEHGATAAQVVVQLHPSDYDPVHDVLVNNASVDTTTSDGRYSFTVEDSTLRYSVQATPINSRLRAFIAGVKAATTDEDAPANCSLQTPGAIRVLRPKNGSADSGYLYLPGSTFFTKVNAEGGYTLLDMVPAGILPSINYVSKDGTVRSVVQTNVAVTAGDTVTIAMADWAYSQSIILNTSATGANVGGTVYKFPVLVRLSSPAFNFAQCKSGGDDLRFVSAGGALLPYEIELWDTAAGKAAAWVKIDTLYGNNSTQSITMFWGNPHAATMANSAAVFDTADGFEGVWHLGEETGDSTTDATPNRYNGVSPVNARPKVDNGILGQGRYFDGSDDFITMPGTAGSSLNFPEDGTFSVSAWVMLDTLDKLPHVIVAKGYYQYFLRCTYFPTDAPLWEFSEFNTASSWQACTTTAISKKWSFLTGVRMGNRQFLYLNGSIVDSTPSNYESGTLSRNTSDNLTIGKFIDMVNISTGVNSYCYYKGTIDEVRISRGANSADWIRLCYMNQRTDDRLVVFK